MGWFLPAFSEYRLVSDTMSELVLGRHGFLQTVAFVVAGASTLALAVAVRAATIGDRVSRTARWRSLAVPSGLLASAAFSLMLAQGQGPRVGLMQRLFVSVVAAWMVAVAMRVRAIVRRVA